MLRLKFHLEKIKIILYYLIIKVILLTSTYTLALESTKVILKIDPIQKMLLDIEHHNAQENKVIMPKFNISSYDQFTKKYSNFLPEMNINDFDLNNLNKKTYQKFYFQTSDQLIEGKIRIDGLGEEHFNYDLENSTLKIKLKKNNYLNNMNEFRIMGNHALSFYDHKYFQLLSEFKYPIVTYSKLKILFAFDQKIERDAIIEESIKKSFIEKNILREGSIYKNEIFDPLSIFLIREKRLGLRERGKNKFKISFNEYFDNYLTKSFNLKTVYQNKKNVIENKFAYKLLSNYAIGKQSLEDTFELNRLSQLFAIHTLRSNFHALQMHNLKFYFNPIINKFYFITTDPFPTYELKEDHIINIKNYIFNNQESKDITFFTNINHPIYSEYTKEIIYSDIFKYYFVKNLSMLVNNYENERILINSDDTNIIKNVRKIKKIFSEKSNIQIIKEFNNNFYLQKFDDEILNFININHSNKTITFKDLENTFKNNLEIPVHLEDYTLLMQPGLKLNFLNNGSLTIYSNVETEKSNTNQNIIINSKSKSSYIKFLGKKNKLRNVNFTNFNFSKIKNENFLTSPITFYETNVELINVSIENINAEDLLNIVNSNFKIENSNFKNSISDLVDIDNSIGEIINSKFINCQNDCLDFSGSEVKLENIYIENSGDKGLSVGENSKININNLSINKSSKLCIAAKDQSTLNLKNTKLLDCEYGIAAFIKKKEFNQPNITINNLYYENIPKPIITENHENIKFLNSLTDIITIITEKNLINILY